MNDRPRELDALEIFIGRWITVGSTVAAAEAPSQQIAASDVYEWMPGRSFVLHTAYGRIGDLGVGGTEIIGYDRERGCFHTHFFDSGGNIIQEVLSCDDGVWTWQGETLRARSVFSADGGVQNCQHQASPDGERWNDTMTVVLRKVE
jgi:Protein of unknown function (DUF1579)